MKKFNIRVDIYIILLISILIMPMAAYSAKAILLPDGNYFPVKEGESAEAAFEAAKKLYPKSFGLMKVADGKQIDLDWFNECKLKAATVSNSAIGVAIQACRYKAIPKKCRVFNIETDSLGNEKGDERVRCVEECNNANYYSKSIGECSKG